MDKDYADKILQDNTKFVVVTAEIGHGVPMAVALKLKHAAGVRIVSERIRHLQWMDELHSAGFPTSKVSCMTTHKFLSDGLCDWSVHGAVLVDLRGHAPSSKICGRVFTSLLRAFHTLELVVVLV